MTTQDNLLERLSDLVEIGHAASPGFIRQVAEDAIAALVFTGFGTLTANAPQPKAAKEA